MFVIILKRKRNLVTVLLLPYRCNVTVHVMWLFITVPWVGLQCVIVVFPDHTHILKWKIRYLLPLTLAVLQYLSQVTILLVLGLLEDEHGGSHL